MSGIPPRTSASSRAALDAVRRYADGFGAELTRLGYGRSTAEAELQSMAH
jgi:hypothetical protein